MGSQDALAALVDKHCLLYAEVFCDGYVNFAKADLVAHGDFLPRSFDHPFRLGLRLGVIFL